jgi:hypothetical protein
MINYNIIINYNNVVPRSKHSVSVLKIVQVMLHTKVIVFNSEIRTKHVNKAELYYRLSPYRAVNTPTGF